MSFTNPDVAYASLPPLSAGGIDYNVTMLDLLQPQKQADIINKDGMYKVDVLALPFFTLGQPDPMIVFRVVPLTHGGDMFNPSKFTFEIPAHLIINDRRKEWNHYGPVFRVIKH